MHDRHVFKALWNKRYVTLQKMLINNYSKLLVHQLRASNQYNYCNVELKAVVVTTTSSTATVVCKSAFLDVHFQQINIMLMGG